MSKKKMEIVFAPGCFDSFDGTQEELDELIAEIRRQVDSGEFFNNVERVPMGELPAFLEDMDFDDLDEDYKKKLN